MWKRKREHGIVTPVFSPVLAQQGIDMFLPMRGGAGAHRVYFGTAASPPPPPCRARPAPYTVQRQGDANVVRPVLPTCECGEGEGGTDIAQTSARATPPCVWDASAAAVGAAGLKRWRRRRLI